MLLLLNPLADSLTDVEKAFFAKLLPYFTKHEWLDNTMARKYAAASPATTRRHMKRLADIGLLEARGTTRDRQYRLLKKSE